MLQCSPADEAIEELVLVDEDEDGARPPTPWSRAALLRASALLTCCRPVAHGTHARVGVGHVVRELAHSLGHARGRCTGRPGPRRRRRGRASSSSWTDSYLGAVVGREGQGATPAGPLEEGPYLTCWQYNYRGFLQGRSWVQGAGAFATRPCCLPPTFSRRFHRSPQPPRRLPAVPSSSWCSIRRPSLRHGRRYLKRSETA